MAISNKHSNYCIAGIDINNREWVRPVSSLTHIERAVPREDATYENGEEVQVLDIVRIHFIQPLPTKAQPENELYSDNIKWKKIGNYTFAELVNRIPLDDIEYIFENNNKALTEDELTGKSLAFVRIERPDIFIKTFEDYNRRVQINFYYNGYKYDFIKVSDPVVLNAYSLSGDGHNYLDNYKYAVFSLTDAYIENGKYYKMLATLF